MEPNSPTNNTGGEAKKPSIHTLEGDIFSAMQDDNYTNNIVKVVTSPKTNTKKVTSYPEPDTEKSGNLLRILGISATALFIISIGVFGYLYLQKQSTERAGEGSVAVATTTPSTNTAVSLAAEAIIQLDLKELNKFTGIERIRKIQQDLRDKQISTKTTVELGLGLTTPEFFAKNRFSGDDGLIRALDNQYSFGLYNNTNNIFESFLLFKVKSPDSAFSNMLIWERYMMNDISDLFLDTSISISKEDALSATSSEQVSSSTPTNNTPLQEAGFRDRIIRNTDARVYTDEYNTVKLVYGFINKEYLIITSGVESFIEIKTRILNDITLR